MHYTYADICRDPAFRFHVEHSVFPERSFDLHTHDFAELVVVRHGRGVHVLEGEEYLVAAGDVFVVRPNDVHGYRDMAGLDLVNVVLDPERFLAQRLPGYHALFHLEPILRQHRAFRSKLHLHKDEMRFVYDLVDSIQEELRGRAPGYEVMAQSYLNLLVAFLSRCYAASDAQPGREVMNLSRVLSWIESNYAEPVRLDELARIACMSRSSLARAFARCCNTTPVGYVIQQRLKKACDLLRNPGLSITDVAMTVGFSDSNYFARKFRHVYGFSPGEFRKRLL